MWNIGLSFFNSLMRAVTTPESCAIHLYDANEQP